MHMAAGTDFSPPFGLLEEGYSSKENTSSAKDELRERLGELKQTTGKPPRHLSVGRHSLGSVAFVAATDLRIPIWWRWYYWANPVAWTLTAATSEEVTLTAATSLHFLEVRDPDSYFTRQLSHFK